MNLVVAITAFLAVFIASIGQASLFGEAAIPSALEDVEAEWIANEVENCCKRNRLNVINDLPEDPNGAE